MTDPSNHSVQETLMRLRGTWHDKIQTFNLDGSALSFDSLAGSPGPSPFENLVYIDFDGEIMTQTNVTFRGRNAAAKTFSGRMVNGLLVFNSLGEGAYDNIGMSAGPDALVYTARQLNESCQRYYEPDFIQLTGPDTRLRTTVLYRDGKAVRTLRAEGVRLSGNCQQRHEWDPRGANGRVHEQQAKSGVWRQESKSEP